MARNSKKDDFNDNNLEDLEDYTQEVFDDEWYEKVTDAINYVFEKFDNNKNIRSYDRTQLAKIIIDYNIEKRIAETTTQIPLPRVYDWRKYDILEIFDELSYLINLCKERIGFKKHEIILKFGKNEKALENFNFWKEVVAKELKDFEITTETMTKNTQITLLLTISKKES